MGLVWSSGGMGVVRGGRSEEEGGMGVVRRGGSDEEGRGERGRSFLQDSSACTSNCVL